MISSGFSFFNDMCCVVLVVHCAYVSYCNVPSNFPLGTNKVE